MVIVVAAVKMTVLVPAVNVAFAALTVQLPPTLMVRALPSRVPVPLTVTAPLTVMLPVPLAVPPDLIRLSVGLEDVGDLLDDLLQALG